MFGKDQEQTYQEKKSQGMLYDFRRPQEGNKKKRLADDQWLHASHNPHSS